MTRAQTSKPASVSAILPAADVARPGLTVLALALVILTVAAWPGQAVAQQSAAAARLPNTFDAPAAARARPPAPAAGAAAPAQSPAPVDAQRALAAETMLRTTIAAMQAGNPNYGDMSADLAGKVREQSSAITPLIQSFGALQSLAHVGVENGADLFLVGFDNQITQWIIALDPEGKIVALLFRPASPPAA